MLKWCSDAEAPYPDFLEGFGPDGRQILKRYLIEERESLETGFGSCCFALGPHCALKLAVEDTVVIRGM